MYIANNCVNSVEIFPVLTLNTHNVSTLHSGPGCVIYPYIRIWEPSHNKGAVSPVHDFSLKRYDGSTVALSLIMGNLYTCNYGTNIETGPRCWISIESTATQIVKFLGPTWGPPGCCRPQMGPMLAP